MWCVERILCIRVHLGNLENSLSHRIYTTRSGDHIEEAPLPVGSGIVTVVICEALEAMDCSPGI